MNMKPRLPFAMAAGASLGALVLPTQDPAAVQEAPYTDRLSKLSWMTGHWRGMGKRYLQEEVWMDSRGNLMLGLHRDHDLPEDSAKFEFLRIEVVGANIVYQASPSGRAATPFTLVHMGERQAVFENPAHDFPQRITYRRTENVLTAEIGLLKGDPAATFTWTLVK
jgi:hypothetical protein